MAVRDGGPQSPSAPAASMRSSETGGSAGLVDEDEFRGIETELGGEPDPARGLIPLTQVAPPRLFLLSGRLEAAVGDHRHGRPSLFNKECQPSSAFVEWSADPAVVVT